jgi:predicted nucleic acid-binding protein
LIALDTSLLVHAHRRDALFHAAASTCVVRLAEGNTPWAIPWPCVHEFLAVVTHPRIFRPPTPLDEGLGQVALCLQHGLRELWTADRDFGRFPALRCMNPLITG